VPDAYEPPVVDPGTGIQPSSLPPTEEDIERTKRQMMTLAEGATNYQDFSKEELNEYYDQLRKQDPEEALRYGLDVNKVLFGYD
jgi:hypothetical protein